MPNFIYLARRRMSVTRKRKRKSSISSWLYLRRFFDLGNSLDIQMLPYSSMYHGLVDRHKGSLWIIPSKGAPAETAGPPQGMGSCSRLVYPTG